MRILGLFFALLGAFFAGLSLHEYSLEATGVVVSHSLCGLSKAFNCKAVHASSYSSVLGVPLAAVGLCFYLFFARLFWFLPRDGVLRRRGYSLLIVASVGAVLFSLYLFYISAVVLDALCLYCIGMYVANAGLFVLALWSIRSSGASWGEGISEILTFPLRVLQSRSVLFSLVGHIAIFIPILLYPVLIEHFYSPKSVLVDPRTFWESSPERNISIAKEGPLTTDHSKGGGEGVVQIVEWSDFECPACRRAFVKVEEYLRLFPGKVRFTTKNFPLDQSCNPEVKFQMHKNACFLAQFTRCGAEQGKFWELYELVFTTELFQGTVAPEEIPVELYRMANELGLDSEALRECVNSGRHTPRIQKDIAEAVALGIHGTPTFFVDGREIPMQHLDGVIRWRVGLLPEVPSP